MQQDDRIALAHHVAREREPVGLDVDLVHVRGLPGSTVPPEQGLQPDRKVQVSLGSEPSLQEGLATGDEAFVDGQPGVGLGRYVVLGGLPGPLPDRASGRSPGTRVSGRLWMPSKLKSTRCLDRLTARRTPQ